jgi:hypothetical protein
MLYRVVDGYGGNGGGGNKPVPEPVVHRIGLSDSVGDLVKLGTKFENYYDYVANEADATANQYVIRYNDRTVIRSSFKMKSSLLEDDQKIGSGDTIMTLGWPFDQFLLTDGRDYVHKIEIFSSEFTAGNGFPLGLAKAKTNEDNTGILINPLFTYEDFDVSEQFFFTAILPTEPLPINPPV